MRASGFVLAGGASKRMGRDKAFLPYRGIPLVEHVAGIVRAAVGNVALVGDPERLGRLGFAVYADQAPSCGPASGIYTALRVSETDWNLVVACDMPGASAKIFADLLQRAETSDQDCVAASVDGAMPEPLCAAYHRRCLPLFVQAIEQGRVKMRELIGEIGATLVLVDPAALVNINTPEEWAGVESRVL